LHSLRLISAFESLLLCDLCITTVESFRGLRKFSGSLAHSKTGICSRQDAKNAKSGIVFSFAAFASLREIFRVSVAALPR
jgi:hypothetical protein